ncbi:NAD(P)H-binding protein [Algoriphagus halophilus]|uniref:NAD(P)H-binding protein n=1 Tax=Algoriphagus halophilus TaxID=226505 RepID=UPI00358E1E29
MTILVVGASGATGKQVVEQLLKDQQKVRVIVRSPEKLPESWIKNDQLSIIQKCIRFYS